MAEKLGKWDWTPPKEAKNVRTKYPYDEWLNGDIWKLKPGVDFDAKPESVRQALQLQAERRMIAVNSEILEDGSIVVQAGTKDVDRQQLAELVMNEDCEVSVMRFGRVRKEVIYIELTVPGEVRKAPA